MIQNHNFVIMTERELLSSLQHGFMKYELAQSLILICTTIHHGDVYIIHTAFFHERSYVFHLRQLKRQDYFTHIRCPIF